MNNKKKLGQFYTTNYKYILKGFKIPENTTNIIEPFCGNGDLLNFIDRNKYNIECYDIDSKKDFIIKKEQEDICDKIINILELDDNNSFILYNLDKDDDKQQQILDLIPKIRKYFSFSKNDWCIRTEKSKTSIYANYT